MSAGSGFGGGVVDAAAVNDLGLAGRAKTVAGSGLPLFKNIRDRMNLKLLKTKTFGSGVIALYYVPALKHYED